MRIAFSTLGRLSITNINRALANVVELRQKVSTGRRFSLASEDPVGAQRAILLTNELAAIRQYRDATQSGLLYLQSTQGILLDLGERLREVKAIALQQRSDTSDASTRATTAVTVRSIRDQILSLLNTEVRGRHLFSGHLTRTEPFAEDSTGHVVYRGDEGLIRFKVGPSQEEITNVTGSELAGTRDAFMLSSVDLSPELTTGTPLASLNRNAGVPPGRILLDNGAGGTATIDTSGMTSVQDLVTAINGSGLGLLAAINAGGDGIDVLNFLNPTSTVTVTDLDGGSAAQALGIAGSGVGVIRGRSVDPGLVSSTPLSDIPSLATVPPGVIEVQTDTASYVVDFSAPPAATTIGDVVARFNATVPELTMSLSPDGAGLRIDGPGGFSIRDAAGSTAATELGIAGAGRTARLFGSLEDLEAALLADDGDGIEAALAEIEMVIDNVVRVQGTVAARLHRLDAGLQMLDTRQLNAQTRLSSVVSTDMAEAVTQLTEAQTLYQSALGTAARVYDLNLFNYLQR